MSNQSDNNLKTIIQNALNSSVCGVLIKDKDLLVDKCSERAIAHWFANYFWDIVRENPTIKTLYKDYIVDAEYNRVGYNQQSKTLLKCTGEDCKYASKCSKYALENLLNNGHDTRHIMIDVIYHHRGQNDVQSNLFCAELKTTSTSDSDYTHICDKERISALVSGNEQIQYSFGATVFFFSPTGAKVRFYNKEHPYKPETYILTANGRRKAWDGNT